MTCVQDAPLVVMNSFGAEEHLKLATTLFQNLFPAINVHTTSLKQCKVRHHSSNLVKTNIHVNAFQAVASWVCGVQVLCYQSILFGRNHREHITCSLVVVCKP